MFAPLSVPPDATIIVPPPLTIAPKSVPPERTLSVWPLLTVKPLKLPEPSARTAPAGIVTPGGSPVPPPTSYHGGAARDDRAADHGARYASRIAVPPALTRLLLAVAPEPTSSTPPLLTVVLVTSPPLATSSMPFLMVQWAVLALLTVQVPPTTLKVVKPRYWTPIELRCAGIRYPAAGAAAAEHGGVDEVETLIAGENLAAVGDAAEECGDFLETDAATIRCGDSAGVCYAAAGAAAAQDRDGADENASLLRRDLTAVDDAAQKSARAVNIYPGEFNRDRAAVG